MVATGSTNHTFKRQNSSADDPLKLASKKKKQSIKSKDETEANTSKSKKLTKSKSKHKEIIDYSMRNAIDESQSNAIGKVHEWLKNSPINPPTKELEHATKTRHMSKSYSTPERLAHRAPKKSKSAGNLEEKVKLQVVYKPPFKFSLKLSKNSNVKTKVIGGTLGGSGGAADLARSKRKSRAARKSRDTLGMSGKGRRAALLIRSKNTDEVDGGGGSAFSFNLKPNSNNTEDLQQLMPQEPNYETLNSKRDSGGETTTMNTAKTSKPEINTNTFRISKSTSGNNIHSQTTKIPVNGNEHRTNTTESKSSGSRSSTANLNSLNSQSRSSSNRGSTTNLSKHFGSSNNLMRSSTTNLSKTNSSRNSFDIKRGFYDMSRSSTTNLSKDRRHGSHLNLLKHQHLRGSNSKEDIMLPAVFAASRDGRNRRNSTTMKSTDSLGKVTSIPRVPSNSNLKMPSLRHGGSTNGNIPRASLNFGNVIKNPNGNPFMRQTSLQQQTTYRPSPSSRHSIAEPFPGRPHTAECNMEKRFDWSPILNADKKSTKNDDPLPSDLEVMVSDVENLVTINK